MSANKIIEFSIPIRVECDTQENTAGYALLAAVQLTQELSEYVHRMEVDSREGEVLLEVAAMQAALRDMHEAGSEAAAKAYVQTILDFAANDEMMKAFVKRNKKPGADHAGDAMHP